jgi:DNA-binding NtrC family response regulator
MLAEYILVNQQLATRMFEKLGHEVTVVGDGREAVSAVQKGKYDLIAMDVEMPEMGGLVAAFGGSRKRSAAAKARGTGKSGARTESLGRQLRG